MADQLRCAIEFVEDRGLKTIEQDLKKVKINHAQCSDVVHNIVVVSEESFRHLKETLLLLDKFDSTSFSKGEGSAMAAGLKSAQDLCFSALAQMEHCINRVRVYVSRCAEVEYWRTAVRMPDFVSPRAYCAESLPNTRSTESFYLLQDFWWSVDVVQLATVCLEKSLMTVVDGKIQYDAFKWCKGKCRLVLKDGGECNYTVLKEDNKEDNICFHHKADLVDSDKMKLLQQLKMEVGSSFAWFPSAGQIHELRLKMFLKQVLEGTPVGVGDLLSTLKIDYHDIKLSHTILGQGSFGVIFEGKWHGETVAVKCIKLGDDFEIKKQVERLEEEVALLASLHHHNIVRLIGFTYDEETKNCLIVMERMQMNLRSLIKHNLKLISKDLPSVKTGSVPRFVEKRTPFPLDVTIDLLLQIIEGMCHLRDFRVIHRDLKSENILVNKCAQASSMLSMSSVATNLRGFEGGHFYHAKLADFGTSKSQMKDSEFFTKGKGSVKWMAPEVLEATFNREDDTLHYSWEADVYSFGITCSELLTGELPFQDVSGRKLLKLICDAVRPPLPPDCPDSLKGLVCECWDTNPQNRPNCWEVRERLWGCKLEMFLHHREKMSVGQTFCKNVQRYVKR
jgi:serine/threonine protein kinase